MSRQKSLRAVLTICCSLALLLYIAAPVFAQTQTQTHQTQPPSAQDNSTMHEPPATGTNSQKSQKSKKTKKSHQNKNNARQKPGTSTGTNSDMNQGKTQTPDTYDRNNPISPDKNPR